MKQTLNLKVTQQLALSPQLQQAIRLLQLSTLEMHEEIERAMEDNPLIEKTTDDSENAFDTSYDTPGSSETENTPTEDTYAESHDTESLNTLDTALTSEKEDFVSESGNPATDEEHVFQHAVKVSLRDHLLSQLALTPVDDNIRIIVMALIDELDDNGYLTTTFESFRDYFSPPKALTQKRFNTALKLLQDFDPVGVGARTPSECLALQLRALPDSPTQQTALIIVEQYLPLLAARDFASLKKTTGIREDLLRDAGTLIRSLNPKPGQAFDTDRVNHIIPDILVRKKGSRWVAQLNEATVPKIRINTVYVKMLSSESATPSEWSNRLQEARWLIRNIQQRYETILRVSQAIVEQQQRFFDHGPLAMKPMVLKDIADLLGLHESTVSRVTTQKFMLTPQGCVELKYFFGSHIATNAGGAVSSTAIRALIKKYIEAESPSAPLSDQLITELLGKEGIMVARRTVAKYRETLSIPPAHQRKDF